MEPCECIRGYHSGLNHEPLKGVLFDLDGTITDSQELILSSFRHTLKTCLGIEVPDGEILKLYGRPLVEQLAYFAPERVADLVTTYRQVYHEKRASLIRAFPGMVEVIRTLRLRGRHLAIVTSKGRQPAKDDLSAVGIIDHFSVLIGAEDVKEHKPNPDAVFRALDGLGLEPCQAIMVGDSPSDIFAGKNAGVLTAVVEWSTYPGPRAWFSEASFVVKSPKDLLQICMGNCGLRD